MIKEIMMNATKAKNKYIAPTTAVIGAGAAGVMAALRGILNNDRVLLFAGNAKDKKKSRAQWVRKVENVPGLLAYRNGIKDPNKETIEFIQESPFAHNFDFKKNQSVVDIELLSDGKFKLFDDKGETYLVDHVVLATGVMDVQPEIEGTIKTIFPYANVQAVDYCIRCDGHHTYEKEVAVIGQGEGAAWVAILLYERYQPFNMTILTDGHEANYSAEVQELLDLYHIDVETRGIDGIKGNKAKGELEGFYFCDGSYVPADFAFISLGMLVYNKLAQQLGVEVDERGFVVTNDQGESSISNFYIAGDLRANTKKQIYTAWDTAVDAMDNINRKTRAHYRAFRIEQKKTFS